jgi:hypothetical protein
MTGNIVNSGTVNVRGDGFSSATAAGFSIIGGLAGDFNNSGTIEAVALDQTSEAGAYGLRVRGGMTGDLTNSGAIEVLNDGMTSASAYGAGIFIVDGGGYNGALLNSGTIETTSVANNEDASSRGVYTRDNTMGSVNNKGVISSDATGAKTVRSQAIVLYHDVVADVSNSGQLNAKALIQNGTSGANASAAGIWVENMQGQFSNTGVINASAMGGTDTDAFGLYFENFDGLINDVGEITAMSDGGNAYAIFLGTGTGTLNVINTDQVTGLIRVQDHNVNLYANGSSGVFEFEDASPGSGTFTTSVSRNGLGWFVQDAGGSAPVYAAVSVNDLVPGGDVVAFYGDVVGSVSNALRYELPDEVSRSNDRGGWYGNFRPFAMIDAEVRQFDSETGVGTDVNLLNGRVGYSGLLDNGLAVAVGMGVFSADGDNDITNFDTMGYYLDAAIGRQIGAYTVEAGLGFGWLSTDRTRQISGGVSADAEYDSTLLTAHLGVERAFQIHDSIDLLGFSEVRYTQQKDGVYTETGPSANATVRDVTTEVIEARLGGQIEKTLSNGGRLIGQLSGVLRRDLGDSTANVAVFSTSQSLAFASSEFNGASLLIGYKKELLPNMTLDLTAEQEFGDTEQGLNVRAGLSWSF